MLPHRSEPATVVILDDDPVLVAALSRMIGAGPECVVERFTEGGAAMEWLSHHSASLLITDYLMPGPTGLDVVRWLRTQARHLLTPVLMLTGVPSAELTAAAYTAGVTRLVSKPIRAEEFLREVGLLLPPFPPAATIAPT